MKALLDEISHAIYELREASLKGPFDRDRAARIALEEAVSRAIEAAREEGKQAGIISERLVIHDYLERREVLRWNVPDRYWQALLREVANGVPR